MKKHTQEEILLLDLEECRWHCMQRLADEAEERGDAALAKGWRWLARNKRWPYQRDKYAHWQFRTEMPPTQDLLALNQLPAIWHSYCPHTTVRPLGNFLLKTARGIGKFLEEKGLE